MKLSLPYIQYFHDDLIFSFFVTTLKSQIIEYAAIIFCIIFYRKKRLTQIKNVIAFPHTRKFCDTQKKTQIYRKIFYR